MERQQLMDLSDWNEEFLHDLINKKIKAGIQSITNVQYALLFTMVQEMECPIYATLEDVLRYAMPAVTVPKKWANVTRSVMNNVNKNINLKNIVYQLTPQEKTTTFNNESIENVCDALGIRRSTLLHPPENLSSTLLTVKAFHEICLFKNRYSYTWSDVAEWTNNMLPEGMLLNKHKVLYLYKKINDNFQSYMKNRQKEDLDTFKSSKFFKFLNSTLQPTLQTDMQKNDRSLKRQCLKLVANQREVLTENQELCFENEVLKEQIVEQKKNIRNSESESVKRNQELRKLRLTKEANVNLKEENKSLKEKFDLFEKGKILLSNRLFHAKKFNIKLKQKLHSQNVDLENKKFETLNLKRELSVANDQLDIIEAENQNKKVSTKEGFRYSDSMRTCIMDLHGSDISANKISNVINIVSNNLFDTVPSDLPCRSTISNICDEGHVLAKHHVSETLANCQQFDIFSDGTGREGKKIIDLGVHTKTGFHNEKTKSLKELANQTPPIGRDSLPKFSRFKHNSEPLSIRLIRMASKVLGPRGDEKNGARQEWLAYLALKQKSSMIINYRGNRFNNLFTGAVSILNHSEDIIDFISNYRENPNDKLQSVLAEIKCPDVLSHVSAIAIASMILAEPFWNVINSDEHYLDLYKFIIPLRDRLVDWSSNDFNVFDFNYDEIPSLYEQYPHEIVQKVFNSAKIHPKTNDILKIICSSMLTIVKRQLNDHLENGVYGSLPDPDLKSRTSHSKLTNIPAENLFEDLDFYFKRKPNATLRHHSAISMLKRNKTIQWLKTKTENSRKVLLLKARKSAKSLKSKEIAYEKSVMEARKTHLQQIKKKKQQLEQKKKMEINKIEQSVRLMGGIVRSRKDVDRLLQLSKTIRLKKEKLRNQLLYCKHFMNLDVDKKDIMWKNTVNQMKDVLTLTLKIDKQKVLEKGIWVAVSYEDNWYPGEIMDIHVIDNAYTVKFLKRKSMRGNTFIWPNKDDIDSINEKFIIYSNFEIMPSPGLRHWLIPDMDEIEILHKQFVEKYFENC
ncbi:unnamed protein product [Mytilus coruscus]|uniref:Uncharacterized protein n=1 Tax=Mytilus coruscus TaxID=42192 RepID=A0A6J8B7Z2_MYTCO|nr:unnamed protein product [Mytilus coruscus]